MKDVPGRKISDVRAHNLARRFNWRQVLVHFLAAWPFIYSCKLLSYLYDPQLFGLIIQGGNGPFWDQLRMGKITAERVASYLNFINVSWLLGLLVSFLVSVFISIKSHWLWVNSIIASLLVWVIYTDPFQRKYAAGWHTTIYRNPVPVSIVWFTIVGAILLALGLGLFFSNRVNKFILNKN